MYPSLFPCQYIYLYIFNLSIFNYIEKEPVAVMHGALREMKGQERHKEEKGKTELILMPFKSLR